MSSYEDAFDAVDRDAIDVVKDLLDTKKIRPNETRHDGESLLHLACSKGNASMVRLLLESGANINASCDNDSTALSVAISKRHVDVVQVLLWARQAVDVSGFELDEMKTLGVENNQLFRILLTNDAFYSTYGIPLFFRAAESGDMGTVQALIHAGMNTNALLKHDKTALHFASYEGQTRVVRVLLDAGSYVNARDTRGETPLISACMRGHIEVVELLLQADANIQATFGFDGRTALDEALAVRATNIVRLLLEISNGFSQPRTLKIVEWAARRGETSTIRCLHEAGVDMETRFENNGTTALQLACEYGRFELVQFLLSVHVDVNAADKNGYTPLCFCLCSHRINQQMILQALLQADVHVNIHTRGHESTPLIMACKLAQHGNVALLLEAGADVKAVDANGRTALFHAVLTRSIEMVRIIVQAQADVNRVAEFGRSPLIEASVSWGMESVQTLLNAGANVSATDPRGQTALHHACWRGSLGVANILLEANAQINQADNDGYTALHIASSQGDVAMAKLLLEHGASPDLVDALGRTPIHSACTGNHQKMVRLLLGANAQVQTSQVNGETPLHSASRDGFVTIVRALLEAGANARVIDNEGATPLFLATTAGHLEVVQTLIRHASNVDVVRCLLVAGEACRNDIAYVLFREMHLVRRES